MQRTLATRLNDPTRRTASDTSEAVRELQPERARAGTPTMGARHPSPVTVVDGVHANGQDVGQDVGLRSDVTEAVRRAIGNRAFSRHLTGGASIQIEDEHLVIRVTSRFAADQVLRRFAAQLEGAASALGCSGVRVEATAVAVPAPDEIDAQPNGHPDGEADGHPSGPATGRDNGRENGRPTGRATGRASGMRGAREDQSLERFVVGESNRIAFATAERIASGLDNGMLSPIYLHGPCGNGKTHLLRGIAAGFAKNFPGMGCKYLTADEFTRQFVQAIRKNEVPAFQRKHRGLRVLCIDDAHAFSGKMATQTELVQTLDAIGLVGATVVLASDESPDHLGEMHESLRSRLCGGAVVPIGAPDPALREQLIRAKATERGLPLDDAAVGAIAHGLSLTTHQPGPNGTDAGLGGRPGVSRSVRELEGALCRVEAMYRVMPELCTSDGRIGALLVSRAAQLDTASGSSTEPDRTRPVPVHTVVRTICRELCVEADELRGRGRHKRVVLARALITHAARETTNLSYPEIARAIGRPNHSTVITAHQRIRKQMGDGERVAIGSRFDGLTMSELSQQMITTIRKQGDSSAHALN